MDALSAVTTSATGGLIGLILFEYIDEVYNNVDRSKSNPVLKLISKGLESEEKL